MAGVMKGDTANVWRRHPAAAMSVRCFVLAVPFACACLAGVYVGWAIGGPNTWVWAAARIVGSGAASLVAFLVVERLCRRAMPLTTLLRLSMVFPDRAPRRFSMALRSTSLRRLRDWAAHPHHESLNGLAEQVVTLAASLNAHDRRTRGHSERTRALAELLIDEMRLSPTQANEVRWGAFLHDIGKLLVPATVLNKPGRPTLAEWTALKRHPAKGGDLVEPLRPFIGEGVEAVRYHHENYDGSGYPDGLRGKKIPLSARVVAVADCFEVMTAVRSYQKPINIEAARKELVSEAGSQFDPDLVRAFLNVSLGRLHWALGLAAWMAEVPLLTFIPRAAAQVSTGLGGGATMSTNALTSVAAASFGAVAVVTPVASHAATGTPLRMPASIQGSAGSAAPGSNLSDRPNGPNGGSGPANLTAAMTATSDPNALSSPGPTPGSDGSSALSSDPSRSAEVRGGAIAQSGVAGVVSASGALAAVSGTTAGHGVNSNAGGNGNGNAKSNSDRIGIAGVDNNAGGNAEVSGNGGGAAVAGADSNAGGAGVAGGNSNAGGIDKAKGHADPGVDDPAR